MRPRHPTKSEYVILSARRLALAVAFGLVGIRQGNRPGAELAGGGGLEAGAPG